MMRARAEREAHSVAAPGPPDLARGVASLTGLGQKLTPGSQRAVDAEVKKIFPQQKRSSFFSGTRLLAMAASIAFVLTALQLARVTADRNAMRAERISRPDTIHKTDTVISRASEKDALVAAMAGPDVKIVPLATKSATRMGRMFWNRASNDWTMVVYTMPPPKPGMTYQVWLVTDKRRFRRARSSLILPGTPSCRRTTRCRKRPQGGRGDGRASRRNAIADWPIVISGSATP